MNPADAEDALAWLLGFAAQWLRQYPWFNDGLLLLGALLLAALVTVGEARHVDPTVIVQTIRLARSILGGTMLAHIASHTPGLEAVVPKYNSKEAP